MEVPTCQGESPSFLQEGQPCLTESNEFKEFESLLFVRSDGSFVRSFVGSLLI